MFGKSCYLFSQVISKENVVAPLPGEKVKRWCITVRVLSVCIQYGISEVGGGRNLSCWLLEFREGVSHFLWVNLGGVLLLW